MKKINFTCPHCGGHQLITEQPLQWIQYDILGFDDDGDLLLDYDRPSIVDDDQNALDPLEGIETLVKLSETSIDELSLLK